MDIVRLDDPSIPAAEGTIGLKIHGMQGGKTVHVTEEIITAKLSGGSGKTIQQLDTDILGLDTSLRELITSESQVRNTQLTNKADLVGGKVPASQLPSFVDDVVEVSNFASLPATGESGKIYVTTDNNTSYRYTGTGYVKISNPVDFATQVEAEGNVENTKVMTSLRVFQNFLKNATSYVFDTLKTTAKTLIGSINELYDNFDLKLDKSAVKQTTGASITDVMSQKATSDNFTLNGGSSKTLQTIDDEKQPNITDMSATVNENGELILTMTY